MRAVLGDKAMAALHAICEALALDYAGIDFGVNAQGDLLLFEANATMVIASPDNDPRWAYRRGADHGRDRGRGRDDQGKGGVAPDPQDEQLLPPKPKPCKGAMRFWGTDGMSDLREWLRANNLEQYAAAFEANDIDLDILCRAR